MQSSRELSALLNLIEDPDEEVYQSVSSKLLSLGGEILPHLEDHRHTIEDSEHKEKLEQIIYKIEVSALEQGLQEWKQKWRIDHF